MEVKICYKYEMVKLIYIGWNRICKLFIFINFYVKIYLKKYY